MMKTFRAKIKMSGSYISRLQSDTLFGGLCWAYKILAGDTPFNDLLASCIAGWPPFIVSDLLPADLLPKPFLPPVPVKNEAARKEDLMEAARQSKKLKETVWLTCDEFRAAAGGGAFVPAGRQAPDKTVLTLHNTISRITNTTLDEGGLYELTETFSAVSHMTLYIRITEGWEDITGKCLALFGEMGIGKRRSAGKGGFSVCEFEPFSGLDNIDGANSFVSLSHFVPAADDPEKGSYKTIVKYPKLDREYAISPNPFKYPLILMVPGSVFYTGLAPRPFYGKAVQNIAPGLPDAIQGCFAFVVPAKIPEDAI
jgi:CRISPR-associated protein Csm4